MRQFYNAYRQDPILQQLVGEIPWGQNLTILSKVKSRDARHYYIKATQGAIKNSELSYAKASFGVN